MVVAVDEVDDAGADQEGGVVVAGFAVVVEVGGVGGVGLGSGVRFSSGFEVSARAVG